MIATTGVCNGFAGYGQSKNLKRREIPTRLRGKDSEDLSGNVDKKIEKMRKDIRTMFHKFLPT